MITIEEISNPSNPIWGMSILITIGIVGIIKLHQAIKRYNEKMLITNKPITKDLKK